ncbi:hypothetical protein Goari_014510, partial [Gossypium aridum]|nr:hypothetical protein [Gossypium aridum]
DEGNDASEYFAKQVLFSLEGSIQAVKHAKVFASIRDVLRNQAGDWILGYNHYLGECSMFEAELWGILDGLTILNNRRYERVLIHIYSMEVLKTIEYRQSEVANSAWYVPKKDNRVVDGIAKLTFDNKEGVLIFEEVPKEILQYFCSDKANGFFISSCLV